MMRKDLVFGRGLFGRVVNTQNFYYVVHQIGKVSRAVVLRTGRLTNLLLRNSVRIAMKSR